MSDYRRRQLERSLEREGVRQPVHFLAIAGPGWTGARTPQGLAWAFLRDLALDPLEMTAIRPQEVGDAAWDLQQWAQAARPGDALDGWYVYTWVFAVRPDALGCHEPSLRDIDWVEDWEIFGRRVWPESWATHYSP